ncbi:MAG TPA: SUMF1/EgtB/PvdO family nonheme iron enzyme [Polyangiaceae bacterium]|nr:SUMF1/EgtB/PvdO family nonheme iron enzyme [Polyangiaceae bacterium]
MNVRFTGSVLVLSVFATACFDFDGYHLASSAAAAGGEPGTGGSGDSGAAGERGDGGGTGSGGAPGNGGAGASGGKPGNGGTESAGGTSNTGGGGVSTGGAANAGGAANDPDSGAPPTGKPSCVGLASTCGPSGNESCCAGSIVPGGTYYRSAMPAYPATVSDFVLDRFEVTVGRFRKFLAAYSNDMIAAGSGKNPRLASDPGWDAAWNQILPADAPALAAAVSCNVGYQTWTSAPSGHETRPMTCLNWYEAYAFCIWDGGRLPTEAEWNYAASGGDEARKYPWGTTAPNDTLAVYCSSSCASAENVGSLSPAGDGRWGQADLSGNAWEWNLDYFVTPYASSTCIDCANLTPGTKRVFRGASFGNADTVLTAASRDSRDPADHNAYVGVRCAR